MVYCQRAEPRDDRNKWERRGGSASQQSTVPSAWTAEHVEARLLAAWRIDYRLPRAGGPKKPGSAHPAIKHDGDDVAEWETTEINPTQFAPTREEVSFMERIFDWLLILIGAAFEHLRMALKAWMTTEVRGGSHAAHCRKNGLLLATFTAWKNEAVELIARRLNQDRVAIF
jgi:hypothetical protein